MNKAIKLTTTDRRALAILYCLYGHHPFLWYNRGKFQWYFGVSRKTRNRLIKFGLLTWYEIQFADHWLAFRDICQISPSCCFDDSLIKTAIETDREAKRVTNVSYPDNIRPYLINDPEYPTYINWGEKGMVVRTEFLTLLRTLPTQSKYLLSNDRGQIKFKANYWPEAAIQAAEQSLQIQDNTN